MVMQSYTQPNNKSPKSPPAIRKYLNRIICGDSLKILKTMPDESVDCVVTSPPYWMLRDYRATGQIGLESSIEEYLERLLAVFAEIRRVLKPTGTVWINFGDTYANSNKGGQQNTPRGDLFDSLSKRASLPKLKPSLNVPAKSLCLIPERFAVKMIEAGWILRNQIIWHKPNAMPQSVKDRFTVDFEKIFFFVKQRSYYFERQFEPLKNPEEMKRRLSNPFAKRQYWQMTRKKSAGDLKAVKRAQNAILKRGRNKRCVWSIGTGAANGRHFAVYPPQLVETPILAGCPKGGIVLDPFMGSGTTAVVARNCGRNFIGIELNPAYVKLARKRVKNQS